MTRPIQFVSRILIPLLFLCAALTLRASSTESDTLRHIFSFWHPEYWYTQQPFNFTDVLSSPTGDTVVQASVIRVNDTFFDVDTLFIRVRMWETVKGTYLSGSKYLCIQPTNDQKPVMKLFLRQGRPILAYTPVPTQLSFVDILSDSSVLDLKLQGAITTIDVSPNGRFALINAGSHEVYIYNLENGSRLLSDLTSFVSSGKPYQFVTNQPVGVRPDSWSTDNTVVLLKYNQTTVFTNYSASGSFVQVFRAFYLDSMKYSPGYFLTERSGKWNNVAKKFITYGSSRFYTTDLNHNINDSSVALSFPISDYYWAQASNRIVLIGYTDTVAIRDVGSGQLIAQFYPGRILGLAANSDGSLLAYLTSDSVLTIINTQTLQGVFAETISIQHDALKGDESSMGFLHGDRVMYLRDKQGHYNFLDLPARKFIANLSPDTEWFISDYGNSLFVRDSIYARFDTFTGVEVGRFPTTESLKRIISYAISPNGEQVIAADSMGLHLWDVIHQKELTRSAMSMIQECYWPADSSTIVVGHSDTTGTIRTYNVLNSATLQPYLSFDSSSTLDYLGYAPDAQSIYFGHGDSLLRYSIPTKKVDAHWILPSHPTALGWRKSVDTCLVGTRSGALYFLCLSTAQQNKFLEGFAPIARLKYNATESALSLCTRDSVVVMRLSDKKAMGRLSKLTVDDFFLGADSINLQIYDGSIIEFRLSDGYVRQRDTRVTAAFRPTHDYYVTVGFRPVDSLKLLRYDYFKDQRYLSEIASKQPAQWSADGNSIAVLDIYNNIVWWRPSHLKVPDSTVNEVQVENIVDAGATPNPTQDGVYLRNLESATPVQVQVLNELGQPCLSTTMSAGEQWLDLRALQSGMYIVSVQTSQALVRAKVMLLR